jgi:hypothetical protein
MDSVWDFCFWEAINLDFLLYLRGPMAEYSSSIVMDYEEITLVARAHV